MTSRYVTPVYDGGSGNKPSDGLKLSFFETGTSTPKNTFSDAAGLIPNSNPVISDSNGVFPDIFITGTYKVVLTDKNNVQTGFGEADPVDEYQKTSTSESNTKGDVKKFDTLSEAVNETDILRVFDGAAANLKERTLDNGGGAMWDWVSGETADGFRIVDHATLPLQLKLRTGFVLDIDQWGGNVGDGTLAIQAALDFMTGGGILELPSTTYTTTDRLLVTNEKICIRLGAGTTWNLTGYIYNGTQVPFGNLINITADGCSVVGMGDSLLQLGVTDGNAIGFLLCDRGKVDNLRMDGNKANNPAIIDDSFQSGISIINHAGGNPGGSGRYSLTRLDISNFSQYGINLFGEQTSEVTIDDVNSHSNGIAADVESVGAGLVMTVGVRRVSVANSYFHNNKTRGVFQSSAGVASFGISFANVHCYDNGTQGFSFTEEANLASVAGVGSSNISVSGGSSTGNGKHGFLIGTFDDVGFMKDVSIQGVTVSNNAEFGILIQTNNDVTNRTSDIAISGNTIENNDIGVGIGSNIDTTIKFSGNVIENNVTANISNSGTPSGLKFSFTPTVIGSTTAGTATYIDALGDAVIIDGILNYTINLNYNTFTGTGNLQLGGFPVTVAAGTQIAPAAAWANGLTITGQAFVLPLTGGTIASVDAVNDGSVGAVAVDVAAAIRVSGTYPVDA